jgi:hypothetical protein
MRCTVYRSTRQDFTYLYVPESTEFDDLPAPLRGSFGEPQAVMTIDLEQRQSLANADIVQVRTALAETGYYLQLPPEEDPSGWLDLPTK